MRSTTATREELLGEVAALRRRLAGLATAGGNSAEGDAKLPGVELLLQSLRDHPTIFCTFDPTTLGLADANRAAEVFYGYPRERLLQMHLSDLDLRPEDELRRHLANGEGGGGVCLASTHRRAGGELRAVELRALPVPGPHGALWVAVVTDVSAARDTEEALRLSECRLLEAQAIAHVGSWEIDLGRQTIWGSEEAFRLYGLSRTSPYLDLAQIQSQVVAEDRPRMDAALHALLAGGPYDEEFRILPANGGEQRILHSRAEVVRDTDGTPRLIRGVIQDVTAWRRTENRRRELEDQLRQAQKMEAVGRLAGGVAHDFNNLLTAILGYCDLLALRLAPADRVAQDVAKIQAAAERAASLTQQLLAFSRKQILQPRVVNAAEMVAEVQKMLGRLLGEDIAIELHLAPDTGCIRVDPGQLHQVLLNLAINARDAMADGGSLTIETANVECGATFGTRRHALQPGEYVVISVSDTGCGMDAATQARLFEPFFTTKEVGKGTGLGLATVHGIVEQSGGHIWVYSEPGAGSVFKVYFPRADTAAQGESAAPALPTRAHGGQTVLVVEDADPVRELTCEMLRGHGYRVLEATGGAEALALAGSESAPIDLLLTDVVMPGMSGRVLAGQLATQHPAVRVLYMSGYTENAIVHHGVLDQGLHFLQKPFRTSDLLRLVQEVLAR